MNTPLEYDLLATNDGLRKENDDLVKERDELVKALSATQILLGRTPLTKESGGQWIKNVKLLEKYPEAS